MSFIELSDQEMRVRVSPQGGSVVDAWYWERPLLRPYAGSEEGPYDVLYAACFPFVPLCGRVEGNAFEQAGKRYSFAPNTSVDKHYLHGDGWLSEWSVVQRSRERLCLSLARRADVATPYSYDARLIVTVAGGQLQQALSITHRGVDALPFGLGFHPYFPLTASTTIQFDADGCRDERNDHLPADLQAIPEELDFSAGASIPDRPIHVGYENWPGRASISNPTWGIRTQIQTTANCGRLQLFTPGSENVASDTDRYICVEPMTHTCNAHRLRGDHGLRILKPGQIMTASMLITPVML